MLPLESRQSELERGENYCGTEASAESADRTFALTEDSSSWLMVEARFRVSEQLAGRRRVVWWIFNYTR